jgi:hypothetical protein
MSGVLPGATMDEPWLAFSAAQHLLSTPAAPATWLCVWRLFPSDAALVS